MNKPPRRLTRRQAKRQAITVAKSDPTLVKQLKEEKADPETERRLMHSKLMQLVSKAIRLDVDIETLHEWLDEAWELDHTHWKDLDRLDD
jgi:DNA-binding transcriptional regulator YhcF (GntR family)